MAERLDGRVALVTGAGRGLGRAYALALAALGARVVVNSPPRPEGASAHSVVAAIEAAGGSAVAQIGSVADPAEARAAVEAAIAAHGRLDILVMNAGTILNRPFGETNDGDLSAMLGIHLAAPFAAVRTALPAMARQGWGRIILTGSGSAAFGLEGQSAYAAAKAGVVGLLNVLKLECGDADICANVVLPVAPPAGRTPASERIAELFGAQAGRLDPAWVAPLICLLASEACPGTGGVYSAVGGRYARVFAAIAQGWQADGDTPPGLDRMIAHAGEIADRRRLSFPDSIIDEIEMAAAGVSPPG